MTRFWQDLEIAEYIEKYGGKLSFVQIERSTAFITIVRQGTLFESKWSGGLSCFFPLNPSRTPSAIRLSHRIELDHVAVRSEYK